MNKASEIAPVCSLCHNPTDNIAPANVPKDAQNALEKADELQTEILKAKNIISDAKTKGEDITSAQADIDRAIAIQNNIPSLWHGFDLKNFDQQIQVGINYAEKAQSEVRDIDSSVPKTSDIPLEITLVILVLVYWIKRIKRG